jgi:cytochrome c-type biogenesis protein CcmE
MTRKQRRLALALGATLAAAGGVALVFFALGSTVSYFYTPADLAAAPSPPQRAIRLGGLVEAGSLVYDAEDRAEIAFVVTDGAARTSVRYRGILPDLFREGQGVVVQGRLGADGALEASEVLAKHDENYMPKEVADALKKQGRWQEGTSGGPPASTAE